jgi:hypothetical protein
MLSNTTLIILGNGGWQIGNNFNEFNVWFKKKFICIVVGQMK